MDTEHDPIVELPPIDRHNGIEIFTRSVSWENQPQALLDEFITLSNGCEGQTIAICDTGIDLDHPELDGMRSLKQLDMTGSQTGFDDHNGHSTFIADQIYRRCPKATINFYKVLGDNGSGSSSGIRRGVDAAISHGADWINASLGASQRYQPMMETLDRMKSKNVMMFAASGNSGRQGIGWPAAWGIGFNVIPTGAFKEGGTRSRFSTFGSGMLCMGAGEGIVGAKAQTKALTRMDGTSMGTPSALALTAGYHSARLAVGHTDISTTDSLRSLIEAIAQDVEAEGRDMWTGFGNITLASTVKAMRKLELPNPFPST